MNSVNLALGKKAEIKTIVPHWESYKCYENSDIALLTDGKTADPADKENGWIRFFSGVGREIIIDLGGTYSVEGFEISFLHHREKDIFCPQQVKFLLSEDGENYFSVAESESPYPASFEMCTKARYSGGTNCRFRAKFAKFVFDVDSYACCDELRVLGNDCDGSETELSGVPSFNTGKNALASRNCVGACHIPVIYFGRLGEKEFGISKEEFLPYLAYIDKNRTAADTMFDSFLFVPGRAAPSGGSFAFEGIATCLSDWEYLLDELFASDKNLCALEDAVAEVKKLLHLPEDHKYNIFLAAPVPKISLKPFGDINGDGIADKLITTDDCVEAYTYFLDETARRFEALRFKNIQIKGWLWNNRTLTPKKRDDEEIFAKRCVDAIHQRGYKCLFMPYCTAGGMDKCDLVGFDATVINPSLYVDHILSESPKTAISDHISLCKQYGFGLGIGIPYVSESDTFERNIELFDICIEEYVNHGIGADVLHIYDQFTTNSTLVRCALSDKSRIRNIYDKLYNYIKGKSFTDITLSEKAEEPPSEEFIPANILPEPVFEQEVCEEVLEYAEMASPADEVPESEEVFDNPVEPAEPAPVAEPAVISSPEPVQNAKVKKLKGKCRVKLGGNKKIAIGVGIAATVGMIYFIKKITENRKGNDHE